MLVSTHVLVKLYDCLGMVVAYFAAPKKAQSKFSALWYLVVYPIF